MVKTTKLLASVALGTILCANITKATDIDTKVARMQAMDKITGRVSVIEVPVNSEVKFGSFSIVVRSCKTRPPEETPENKAFVDVVDNYNNEKPVNIFKGWMFSSSPSINAVEHPIYDVWLLKCHDENVKGKLLSAEELAKRDEIEQVRDMNSPSILKNKDEQPEKTEENFIKPVDDIKILEDDATKKTPVVVDLPAKSESLEDDSDGAPKAIIKINDSSDIKDEKISEKIEVTPEKQTTKEVDKVIKIEAPLVEESNVIEEETAEQIDGSFINLGEEIIEDEYDINAEALIQ